MKARNYIMAFLFALSTIGLAQAQTVVSREFPLCFRWDNPHYDKTYLDNPSVEKELFSFIDSVGTANIDRILIETFASPDGSLSHNNDLCKLRSDELKWLILTKFPETRGKFQLRSAGESWGKLRERVAADKKITDASRDKVLRILDDTTISLDTRKYRLSKTLGSDARVGDLWQYLLRSHYRYIRCGGIIIVVLKDVNSAVPDAPSAVSDASNVIQSTSGVIPSEAKEPADTAAPAVAPKPLTDTATVIPSTSSVIPSKAEEPVTSTVIPSEAKESKRRVRPDREPMLGISTNLLYDATYIPHYGFTSVPSVSLEYYPRKGHWTFGADVDWSHWLHYDNHRFNQIHNITLQSRRYFKPGEDGFSGLYLLGNVNVTQYGLGWDAKGWEGEGAGFSLGVGNKWRFARIYIDVGACVGALYSAYDPYNWGNDATGWYYYDYTGKPEDFSERSKRLLWFGPTRIWFSIGYDLLMRRKK